MKLRHRGGALLAIGLVVSACGAATPTGPVETAPASHAAALPTATPAPSPTPAATPSPTPTPTLAPTPVPKTIADLLKAKHPKVSYAKALAAIRAAVAADPVGREGADSPWSLAQLSRLLKACKQGEPGEEGNNLSYYRSSYCGELVMDLYLGYRKTGVGKDYDAALAVYNDARSSGIRDFDVKSMDDYLMEVYAQAYP